MPTLATTVDGLKLPNPFVIGSGPPGANLNVITRAFREDWGPVIAKGVAKQRRYALFVALYAGRIIKIEDSPRGGDGRQFALRREPYGFVGYC